MNTANNACVAKEPLLVDYVKRFNIQLNDIFDSFNFIEGKMYKIYLVPIAENGSANEPTNESADCIGRMSEFEGRLINLNSKLKTLSSHVGEII